MHEADNRRLGARDNDYGNFSDSREADHGQGEENCNGSRGISG